MLFVLPEELVHFGDFVQYEETTPHDGWTWWAVMFAIQVAAQHGDPQHGLLQRWSLARWLRCVMRMAVQCLPFDRLQQDLAGQVRINPCQQGRIQDSPGDNGEQGRCPHKPVEIAELTRLDLAAAFQYAVPRFNCPAARVPGQPLEDIFKRGRGHRTEQHPFKGLNVWRGRIFDRVNRKYIGLRQVSGARFGRLQSHGFTTQCQTRSALGLIASGWHQQVSVTQRRSSQNALPEISLGMTGAAIHTRADQPVHTFGALGREQLVQVALTVAYGDEPGLGTPCLKRAEMLEAFKPFDAFLFVDRSRFAPMLLAKLLVRTHPRFHTQHPKWQTFGRHGQHAVHHETSQKGARDVTESFRTPQVCQIEFSCVMHGQHNRYLPHAIQRLRNVRRQHAVRIDPRIVEEPIRTLEFSGFERLRKRAMRAAGEPTRQGNKTPR